MRRSARRTGEWSSVYVEALYPAGGWSVRSGSDKLQVIPAHTVQILDNRADRNLQVFQFFRMGGLRNGNSSRHGIYRAGDIP